MPIITDLRPLKYQTDRFKLFIEGEFVGMVPRHLVEKHGLKEGIAYDEKMLAEIMAEAEEFNLSESAYRYLSIRPHSIAELKQKLAKKGYPQKLVSETIKKLIEGGYLDDQKFAENLIKARVSSKPKGRKALVAELRKKGIAAKLAEATVENALSETPEEELAFLLLQKNQKRFSKEKSVDLPRKIYNFLSYRGFRYQAMKAAADRFIKASNRKDCGSDEKL